MACLVKVCGITRAEDAERALALGAAAIGLIFHPPSPRAVAVDAAREVLAGITRPRLAVGVFVDRAPTDMLEIARALGLDAVQLSGDEPPAIVAALAAHGIPVLKALRPRAASDLDCLEAYERAGVHAFLVDAFDPGGLKGGSGRLADRSLARLAVERASRPVLLAGGLTPATVAAAIAAVRPAAVDVASGVESSPGIKNPARLSAFFTATLAPPSPPPDTIARVFGSSPHLPHP